MARRATKYLFSYGSNNPTQLAERLGHSITGEAAFVRGYHRAFRGMSRRWGGGVATLIPAGANEVTYGYVAKVSDDDLEILDGYEGVPVSYRRETLKVTLQDGRKVDAIAYLSNSREKNKPSDAYLQAVADTIGSFWLSEEGERVQPSDITIRNPR